MRYPDYLAHYGIKGMKWGVRRKQPSFIKKALKKYGDRERAKTEYWSKRLDTSGEKPIKIRGPVSAIGYGTAKAMGGQMSRNEARQRRVDRQVNAEHRMSAGDRRKSRLKTAAKIAGVAAGVGAIKYAANSGAYRIGKKIGDRVLSGGWDGAVRRSSNGRYSGKDLDAMMRKRNLRSSAKMAVGTAAVLGGIHGLRRIKSESRRLSRNSDSKTTTRRRK